MDDAYESDDVWNEPLAAELPGKTVLVGLRRFSAEGFLVDQQQFAGRVVWADPRQGIGLELLGRRAGGFYTLPPDTRVLRPAPEGDYTLRSTGEVVVNPDYTASFRVTLPPEGRGHEGSNA